MKCYLFDTNIWARWYREDADIIGQVKGLGKSDRIILSAVVWGEAVYGANIQSAKSGFDFSKYRKLIEGKSFPTICEINKHTADIYGELRAKLFKKYARKDRRKQVRRPEELECPSSSKELQIQENDLWLVAQAIAYKYTFVTRDKMNAIKAIAPQELKCENW